MRPSSLTRRAFLAFALPIGALLLSPQIRAAEATKQWFVYFGTYTKGKSQGIYRARLDAASGKLSPAELAIEARDPAFLAVHPNGRFLYAIDESSDPAKTPGQGLTAYAIDPASGKLSRLNQLSAGGPGPCHLVVDASGRALLVANYSGGSTVSVSLQADGSLGAINSVLPHEGSSVHPTRQKRPHAHAVAVSPDNRFALTADLGIDRVLVYRLDAAKGMLARHEPPSAALPPGSGPRHLAFGADGKFLYVINELLCTMSVFAWDGAGVLRDVQTTSTLPTGETVQRGFSTAELSVHPSGRFLYGSNRGHNSIAVFTIDRLTGKLTLVQVESTQGKTPRHFVIDPTGAWLLAENQDSDTVTVFRIDQSNGRLTPTGQQLAVPVPVCAVFVAAQ
jgi:6-phosphogluconolactonase